MLGTSTRDPNLENDPFMIVIISSLRFGKILGRRNVRLRALFRDWGFHVY